MNFGLGKPVRPGGFSDATSSCCIPKAFNQSYLTPGQGGAAFAANTVGPATMVSTRVDEEERLLPSVVAVGLMSTPHTLVEDKEEKDVPVEVREHVGELGRHYRALSKRHVFCLSLLAAALIFLENDDVR